MNQLSHGLVADLAAKYVMDTSALIDFNQMYHREVFKTLWRRLEEAARDKKVIFVDATWEELNLRSVHLAEWISENNYYMHQPTPEEQEFVGLLQESYPDLVDWNASREFADPYIVACANHFGIAIVTQEKHNPSRSKIPTVARDFDIKCLNLTQFFIEIGWEF